MLIDREKVEHVALLARLRLSEEETLHMTQELEDLLGFMDQLNELDTKDVDPLLYVQDINNVFRKDEVRPSMQPEEVVANAPEAVDNQFCVPRIMVR